MGNLGETKTINKLVIEMGGNEYEFSGGGGGLTPGVPIPENTVNSAAIIDGNVGMEDLSENVKNKIKKTYDEDDETLHMDFEEEDVNNSNQEVGQGGSEDEDLDDDLPGGGFNDPMNEQEGD